ncbi:hypothetical protein BC826DRAFT_1120027, partial [Russula brevipes]
MPYLSPPRLCLPFLRRPYRVSLPIQPHLGVHPCGMRSHLGQGLRLTHDPPSLSSRLPLPDANVRTTLALRPGTAVRFFDLFQARLQGDHAELDSETHELERVRGKMQSAFLGRIAARSRAARVGCVCNARHRRASLDIKVAPGALRARVAHRGHPRLPRIGNDHLRYAATHP